MSPATSLQRIALQIRAKRRESGIGLRTAAAESGISAATLSRLERGLFATLPDTPTLTKVAAWLGTSVSELLKEPGQAKTKTARESTLPEMVEVHLRADKNLPPETAKA